MIVGDAGILWLIPLAFAIIGIGWLIAAVGGLVWLIIQDIGNFFSGRESVTGYILLSIVGIIALIFVVVIVLPIAIVFILSLAILILGSSPIWIPVGAYVWIIYRQLISSNYP